MQITTLANDTKVAVITQAASGGAQYLTVVNPIGQIDSNMTCPMDALM